MYRKFLFFVLVSFLFVSCGERQAKTGWRFANEVYVAIDETFHPIMEEELQTFALHNVDANPQPLYCSEDSALRMLLTDSIRCCVVTRPLSESEREIIKANRLTILQAMIATDAFALIMHKNNPDSMITLNELKKIVTGEITRWEQLHNSGRKGEVSLVFDHSGSSTVRYMRDSLCGGKELKGNLFAQGSNKAVIDFVKNDSMVIGVVGANWLKDQKVAAMNDFSNLDVYVMKVSRDTCPEDAVGFRPYQYRIATADYPLLRSVYVITTDPRRQSNTQRFHYFLKGQKGQTIICNFSQMLPITPVQVKAVSVRLDD